MKTIPLALGAVLTLAGCDHNPLEATLPGNAELAPPGRAVLVTQIGTGFPADPIEITGAVVVNDTLNLTVRYIGGCVTHSFGLLVSTTFTTDNPVEASTQLTHSAAGESCQVPVGGSVKFDVTPVRDLYRTTFGVVTGEVLFRIEPGDRTARYQF